MTISLLIKTPKLHHVRDITLNSLHHPAHNTYSISNSPMVLQDITYMINPTFEEVMDKLVIETHCMAIQEQKRGQEEAFFVQF